MLLILRRFLPLTAVLAFAFSAAAAPGDLPLRLAIQTDGPGLDEASVEKGVGHLLVWPFAEPAGRWQNPQGRVRVTESVTRRMLVHLVPQLEEMGYAVVRVKDMGKALGSGNFNAGLYLHVDAENVYVHGDSLEYDKSATLDVATGVSISSRFKVWAGPQVKQVGTGTIPRFESGIHATPGGGMPVVDDEEAMSRLLADELAKSAGALLRGGAGSP